MAYFQQQNKRRRMERLYREVPALNPSDAGFIREVALPDFATTAQRDATAAAQQPSQQRSQRRQVRPSEHQHVTARNVTSEPMPPRGPEGVLQDDSDDEAEAALAAAEAERAASATAPARISDTLAALRLLHAQFPAAGLAAGMARVMLKAQLYSVVANRTAVDMELDELRRTGVVRVFKLASGAADEYAYMFTDDYKAVLQQQKAAFAAKQIPAGVLAVLDRFLESVVSSCPEVSISHSQLVTLLSKPRPPAAVQLSASTTVRASLLPTQTAESSGADTRSNSSLSAPVQSAATTGANGLRLSASADDAAVQGNIGSATATATTSRAVTAIDGSRAPTAAPVRRSRVRGSRLTSSTAVRTDGSDATSAPQLAEWKVTDAHISLLLNAGLLARHPSDRGLYLFTVPHTGPLVKSMAKGRDELLGLISRRKYGELFERDLADRKLQRSKLDMRFHIRDLLGHGDIEKVQTTAGVLLRAVKRG